MHCWSRQKKGLWNGIDHPDLYSLDHFVICTFSHKCFNVNILISTVCLCPFIFLLNYYSIAKKFIFSNISSPIMLFWTLFVSIFLSCLSLYLLSLTIYLCNAWLCKHPKFSPSSSVYISYVTAYHCMHSGISFHYIASHCMSSHLIIEIQYSCFQNISIQIDFKNFSFKVNFKTWVLNQHLPFVQPPGSYISKCFFQEKQFGFILNSI